MNEPRVSDEQLRVWSKRAVALASVHHALSGKDSEQERFLNLALDLRDARARITALEGERDEARAHVRNHHLEACESCAATESERDGFKAGSQDAILHFNMLEADFDALRAERDRLLAECKAWRTLDTEISTTRLGSKSRTELVNHARRLRAANEAKERDRA